MRRGSPSGGGAGGLGACPPHLGVLSMESSFFPTHHVSLSLSRLALGRGGLGQLRHIGLKHEDHGQTSDEALIRVGSGKAGRSAGSRTGGSPGVSLDAQGHSAECTEATPPLRCRALLLSPTAHAHTHAYSHTCAHSHAHMHARTHTQKHTHAHSRTCTHVHTRSHMHTCAHTHAHMLAHAYTHTHAHVAPGQPSGAPTPHFRVLSTHPPVHLSSHLLQEDAPGTPSLASVSPLLTPVP